MSKKKKQLPEPKFKIGDNVLDILTEEAYQIRSIHKYENNGYTYGYGEIDKPEVTYRSLLHEAFLKKLNNE
jgi:hypothetical protein